MSKYCYCVLEGRGDPSTTPMAPLRHTGRVRAGRTEQEGEYVNEMFACGEREILKGNTQRVAF